jgi:phosphocarrier protein HPr
MRSVADSAAVKLAGRAWAAVFLRSFAVQGSWNYRGLIGTGFAFALLPALREIYRGQPERLEDALRRHNTLFNSHPYLTPVALGAVVVMEATGEDPALIERFKTAVRGSLGTLGDRLVWAMWRPVCLLLALSLAFAGAVWWAVLSAFLMVYNAGHIWRTTAALAYRSRTTWWHGRGRVSGRAGRTVRRGRRWAGSIDRLGLALGGRGGGRRGGGSEVGWSREDTADSVAGGFDAAGLPSGRTRVSAPAAGCEQTVQIRNRSGMHARPAAEFVKAANRFRSEVLVRKQDLEVSGKSILGVMMLAAEYGSEITIRAVGEDATEAVAQLVALVERQFGEE